MRSLGVQALGRAQAGPRGRGIRVLTALTLAATSSLAACHRHAKSSAHSAPPLANVTVCVVGTIHKQHLVQAKYPLALLGRLIHAYRPDLVLVEIRPKPFALKHYEDGPFEMTYVTLVAESTGVRVAPIDWWRDEDVGRRQPPLPAAVQAKMKHELAPVDARYVWPPSFAEANGPNQASVLLAVRNVEARYDNGDSSWNERQAWFGARAVEATERQHARRVMAFVGEDHRPELQLYLAGLGAATVAPTALGVSSTDVSPGTPAPDRVVAAWRAGIPRLRALVATTTGPAQDKFRRKLRYFQVAVERRGACCVQPATLEPVTKPSAPAR